MSVISDQQIANIAKASGWTSASDIARAVAIALAESGGRSDATNHNTNGSVDYGLWQVNSVHGFPVGELLTPTGNGRYAYRVYQSQGWNAWTVYRTGAYLVFLPRGNAVAAKASGSGSVNDPPIHTDWPSFPGTDFYNSLTGIIKWITNPHNWQRVGMFILGLVLVIVGLFKVTGDNKLSATTKAAIGTAARAKVA